MLTYIYIYTIFICVYILYIGAYGGEQFSSVRTCKEVNRESKKRGPIRTVMTYKLIFIYYLCVLYVFIL